MLQIQLQCSGFRYWRKNPVTLGCQYPRSIRWFYIENFTS